jgi:hypothetical protein
MTDDEQPQSEEPSRNIPLFDPERDRIPAQELMLARAKAIQMYASVEQSLASLFGVLVQTSPKIAGIIFFRIVNTRSRNAILEGILKERHGTAYDVYWTSILKMVVQLDSERNEIIHWHVVQELGKFEGDRALTSFKLSVPNFWAYTATSPSKSAHDINQFSFRCDYVTRSLNMFTVHLQGDVLPAESASTWREIFQQPAVYPPPDNHPLYRKP